ncbi:hypothetical protein BUALT_Bualt15G0051500 [Buddleja alternifolia]|uniref:Uncharacterized protein n=1 Tax=Buddleja alternifolia TaxID=168488 RepID=A0AAV6WKX5_9LAMI|nr:hypothetical protein BUALT_Bualt15G0051500 [Buddleja alternifolia]
MSMVSDASSGPPHLLEEEEIYGGNRHDTVYSDESLCKKKRKNEKRRRKVQEHSSLLDDTASSPFLDLSNKSNFTVTRNQLPYVENVLEYSQGYSTTQFEVRPSYQEHYDFFQASTSANQLQQNQWFEGKRW